MHRPGRVFLYAALIVALCGARSIAGENSGRVRLSHPITASQRPILPDQPTVRTLPDTVRLLAVMVEFVTDTDPLTTGTGRFDTSRTNPAVIDPPPHDAQYFRHHLRFLENYWRSVTNGQIVIVAELVDTVIHLSQPMAHYSPPSSSTTNRELADLIHETWRMVDSLRPAIDFTRYHSFCIFHAGVGRDIDMTSLLGYDPTPNDIPSLTMNLASLRRALGQSYNGVPVENGTVFVTNSMVLPETESRLNYQFGINGLLAASFGSFLGLPDLFDTRSGNSVIGRFGLMDGQSIFSWNGVFPPEPSAWEKHYLDRTWGLQILEIVEAPSDTSLNRIPSVGRSSTDRDTIVRVSISPREYFLIENRNRDARGDGAIVRLATGGGLIRKEFRRDTVGFNSSDQRALAGVVIDVDEYDWSLPGGVSTNNDFFDGGALIWHVDENAIETGLATNTINANPMRRGIDLEEADGSQDIGQSYGFISPGAGSESGTPLDFWFAGNSSPVYRNQFSQTSYPNSSSNTGANSHITLRDFSHRGSSMIFQSIVGVTLVRPMRGYPRFVGRPRGNNSPQLSKAIFVTIGDSIFAFRPDTATSATTDPRGLFSPVGGQFPVALGSAWSDTLLIAGVQDSTLYIWRAIDANNDGVFDATSQTILPHSRRFTSPTAIANRLIAGVFQSVVCVGDEGGQVMLVGADMTIRFLFLVGSESIRSISLISKTNVEDSVVAISGRTIWHERGTTGILPYESSKWTVVGMDDGFVAADVGGSTLLLLDKFFNVTTRRTIEGKLSHPAIADLDGDGRRDVLFSDGRMVAAINQTGAAVDNFPIILPVAVSGAPIVSKISQMGAGTQVFVSTADGRFWGYDQRGKALPGFPISLGTTNIATPGLFGLYNPSQPPFVPVLCTSDSSGYLYAWRLQAVSGNVDLPWSSYLGALAHSNAGTLPLPRSPLSSEFLPASRAYNWPNPVYDGKTYIRYYLNSDASVRIRVLDLDGQIVDEFSGPGRGGFDNELEWNASKVQSGVYFGHIEAQGGGENGLAIIKIAVVK